jgi:hypothetical protein
MSVHVYLVEHTCVAYALAIVLFEISSHPMQLNTGMN